MFDLFWVHLGFPRSESIFGNLVLWDSMLGALGLHFGLMFDLFWDHFGIPRPDSIFGNMVLLGFHVGSSGARFWKPGDV